MVTHSRNYRITVETHKFHHDDRDHLEAILRMLKHYNEAQNIVLHEDEHNDFSLPRKFEVQIDEDELVQFTALISTWTNDYTITPHRLMKG